MREYDRVVRSRRCLPRLEDRLLFTAVLVTTVVMTTALILLVLAV